MSPSEEARFQALYDHYKDSFSKIRENERERNRLFLYSIALIAAPFLFADYPNATIISLKTLIGKVAEPGIEFLPAPIIASALWAFLFVGILRYVTVIVAVERQYIYLHRLEVKLAEAAGDDELFRREGRSYAQEHKGFSSWVWVVYTFVFPGIVIIIGGFLIAEEWTIRNQLGGHFWFDSLIFLAVTITFLLRLLYVFDNSTKE